MKIRNASYQDRKSIETIYVAAFPKDEGDLVSKVALGLLAETTGLSTISLVAEVNDNVVGHIAYSPVEIEHNSDCLAYILAPLAILPEFQKQSIGSALVKSGIQKLSENGVNYVFVYGDPKYYGKFGFQATTAENFIVPYKLQFPFGWLGLALNPCKIYQSPVGIQCVPALSDPEIW